MTQMRDLTVATYNIHKGVGTDRRRDPGRIAAVIAELRADILALQEVDSRVGPRTGLLDLSRLASEAGLTPVPMQGVGPAHGWHGNLLMLRDMQVLDVQQINLPGFEPRGAVITDLTVAGQPLRVVNAHLGLLATSRAAQVRSVLARLDAMPPCATLLMGDLNEWRNTAQAMRLLAGRFVIAPSAASFPSHYPVLRLDRIMSQGGAVLRGAAPHVSPLSRRASDHMPVVARLHISNEPL